MTKATHSVIGQIEMMQPPSLDGLFWIDPEKMGTVNDVINSAAASTMWLGARTRTPYFVNERDAIKAAFENSTSLSSRDSRAIDIGFMYGTLLGGDSSNPAELDPRAHLPDAFVDDLADRVAVVFGEQRKHIDYHLFHALRNLEVDHAGSDVVAYGLAAAQDHIGSVLTQRDTNDADTAERLRLQNFVYAGVMSGAMAVTDKALPMPEVEILRSLRLQGEVVSIRAEFEPSDIIAQSVNSELIAKQHFVPVIIGRKRHYAAVDGNVQFGPNLISVPLFTPGYYHLGEDEIIPANQVEAVVVRSVLPQEDRPPINTFRIVEGSPDLEDLHFDGVNSISGIIHKQGYVSGLHPRHPWDAQITDLIKQSAPDMESGRIPFSEAAAMSSSARLKYILGAMAAGVFVKDIFGYATLPNYEMDVAEAGAAMGGVGIVALLTIYLKRVQQRHRRELAAIDNIFQSTLDEMILPD